MTTAHAQYNNDVELGIFNHMSVGLGLGTTGISVDVAAPISRYVAVRAGADILPNVKIKTALDLGFDRETQEAFYDLFEERLPNKIDFEAKVKFSAGHLLFDVYPFNNSSFHVTAGAYLGSKQIGQFYTVDNQWLLRACYEYNHSDVREYLELDKIGTKLGNYFIEPDATGNIKATLEVNALRPYIGIGFGRAVPTKHRFACNFDLGFQFWGSPKLYVDDASGKRQLAVLNIRCVCRLF